MLPAASVLLAAPTGYAGWYSQGKELEESGKLDQAVKAFESALKLKPKSTEALEALAKTCRLIIGKRPRDKKIRNKYIKTVRKLDDKAELQKAYEFIARKDPAAHETRYQLAKLYLEEKDKGRAYTQIRKALKSAPKNSDYQNLLVKAIETDEQVRANYLRLKKLASHKGASYETRLLYARACVLKRQYTLASKEYEAVYRKNKKKLKGNRDAVRILYIKKKYDMALQLANLYLVLKPEDNGVREMQVACYERTGADTATLRRAMTELVKRDPDTKKWWLKLARLDIIEGDGKAAVKHAKTWIKRNPRSTSGYKFIIPLIARDSNERETYVKVLEKLIALDPRRSQDRRRKLGLMKFEDGKYAEAEKLLLRSLKYFPKDAEVWYALGKSRLKLNIEGKSEYSFKKAYLLKPDSVKYARAYGAFLESDNGIKRNLKLFKLLEKYSPTIEEQIKLAKSYSFNRDDTSAARVWKQLMEMDHMFIATKPAAAISMVRAGYLAEVLKQYEHFKDNFQVNLELGKQMNKLGQKLEAVTYYIAAYKIKPENITVLRSIASLYQDLKEYSKALDAYTHILKIRPRDRKIQKKAEDCAKRSGNKIYLRTIYEVILEKDPASHPAHYGLAVVYLKEQKKVEAVKHLQKAIKLQPRNKKYRELLQKVMQSE
jgi:tetratricopeptide (TPR) repeat protein